MPTPNQAELEQIKLAMAGTNHLFTAEVIAKRNFRAIDEIYTTGARVSPPGAPLVAGRAAIQEFWTNLVQAVKVTSAVLTSVDVMPCGDDVVEIGRAVLTLEPAGQGTAELEVKYVVYWRQQDGPLEMAR